VFFQNTQIFKYIGECRKNVRLTRRRDPASFRGQLRGLQSPEFLDARGMAFRRTGAKCRRGGELPESGKRPKNRRFPFERRSRTIRTGQLSLL